MSAAAGFLTEQARRRYVVPVLLESERELPLSKMSSSPPSSTQFASGVPLCRPAPEDEGEVRSALEASKREKLVSMTAEAFEHWMVTGEAPCPDSSGSGNVT